MARVLMSRRASRACWLGGCSFAFVRRMLDINVAARGQAGSTFGMHDLLNIGVVLGVAAQVAGGIGLWQAFPGDRRDAAPPGKPRRGLGPDWRGRRRAGTISCRPRRQSSPFVEARIIARPASSPTGIVLRLVGPLIQVICFALLMKWGGQERTVLGVEVEHWLYGGFGVGLVLVLLGLTVFRARPDGSAPDPAARARP